MAKGQYDSKIFMDSIIEYSVSLINEAKSGTKPVHFEREFKKKTPAGKCPACGSPVMENSKSWGCSAWKTKGCKFSIWKEDKFLVRYNKTVTATMAKALLKDRIAEAKGLTKPGTQEKFDSMVKLVQSNGYWNLVLANEPEGAAGNTPPAPKTDTPAKAKVTPTDFICPICKKNHLSFSDGPKFKGWGCHGWKEGCRFSIPFQLYGVNLEQYVPEIVDKGSTDIISSFVSGDGKTFSARLVARNGKLEMEHLNK
jgi:Zn finger protein HypA/HybF involved in hydrogenase expression